VADRSGKRAEIVAEAIGVAIPEQSFGGAMRLFPHWHGRGEQCAAFPGQVQSATAAVFGGCCDFHEAAALEGLQCCGERRAIHGEERSNRGYAWRLRAIERHQQRELSVGKAERTQGVVEAAREGAGRALNVEAEAAVADPEGGLKRKYRRT
jgi:hypothetical protein